MKYLAVCLLLVSVASAATHRRVYIMAVSADAQVIKLCSSSVEIERRATSVFRKENRYAIANSLTDSDFVFVVFLDPRSDNTHPTERAIAINSGDFSVESTITELQTKAFWSSTGNGVSAKRAAMGIATLGWSTIGNSVSKDLAKQFHKEVQ